MLTMVALGVLLRDAPWAIPLSLLGLLAGSFPTRKALFGETWGFQGYLAHVLRFGLAGAAFWLALLAAPSLIMMTDRFRWPLAIGMAVTLLWWEHFFPGIFRRLLGVVPLDRPDLDARFAGVLERSRTTTPRLYRLARAGGRWANALALPSFRAPGVIFGETLLAELEPGETTAILAHEVAHLEHYDRQRLLTLSLFNWLAIGLAVGAVPLAMSRFPSHSAVISLGWALVLAAALVLRSTGRRAHEADSDRRAVALCGDAEALARALTKLHALSRVPRRWSPEMERRATHPSLARRIQAIRAAAGIQSAVLGAPAVARTLTPGGFVILEAERAAWLDGVPPDTPADPTALRERAATVQSVRYSELNELRVWAATGGAVSLVATGRGGFARAVPLDPADVASVQAALDLVDVRLGPAATGSLHHPALGSLVASAAVLVSLYAVGLGTVVIPGLVAALRPTPMALAALGLTALGQAALALLRAGEPPAVGLEGAAVAVLAILGALGFGLGWTRARAAPDSRRAGAALVAAPLAAFAGVAWAVLGWTARTMRYHVRKHHLSGDRRRIWAGRVLVVAALLPVLMGSDWVGSRLGRDPLSTAAPLLTLSEATAVPLRQARVELPATALRLSPSGLLFAVRQAFVAQGDEDDADSPATTFRVGGFAGAPVDVDAEELALLDDTRALALVRGGGGWRVELHDLTPPTRVSWGVAVPELGLARLGLEAASGAWTVSGLDPRSSEIVSISGVAGRESTEVSRWKRPAGGAWGAATRGWDLLGHEASARTAVVLTTEYRTGFLPWSFLAPLPRIRREVWALGPRGSTRLAASAQPTICPPAATSEPARTCATYHRGSTTLWAVEPDPAHVRVLGSVAGWLGTPVAGPGGRLAAWTDQGTVLVIDSRARAATRLRLSGEAGRGPGGLYPMAGLLGTIAYSRAKVATVTVWEIR